MVMVPLEESPRPGANQKAPKEENRTEQNRAEQIKIRHLETKHLVLAVDAVVLLLVVVWWCYHRLVRQQFTTCDM